MSKSINLNFCNAHHLIRIQCGRIRFYASVNENYHPDFDGIGADDSYTVVMLHPQKGMLVFTLEYDSTKETYVCRESNKPEEKRQLYQYLKKCEHVFDGYKDEIQGAMEG